MIRRASFALLAALPVAGCAVEQDPARAGFFSGISNITSGTYDRREAALRGELQQSQTARDAEQARTQETRTRLANWTRQRTEIRQRLQALDRRIAQLRSEGQVEASRLAQLQADTTGIQRENDELGRAEPSEQAQVRARELARRTEEAEARISALIGPAVRR